MDPGNGKKGSMRGHRRTDIPEQRRPRPQQQPPQQAERRAGPSGAPTTAAPAPVPSSGVRGHATVVRGAGTGSAQVRHSAPKVGPEGRASMHRVEQPHAPLEGKDAGKRGGVEKSRGTMRGARVIPTVLRTRPQSCQNKIGSGGKQVSLTANYFRLLKKPNWNINLYHVEFSPPVELIGVRKSLLSQHKSVFTGYIFDGNQLFSPWSMSTNQDKVELVAKNRENEPIKITIKFVKVIEIYDYQYLHVLNLILRRSMECLKLQLVGRNYFDAKQKIDIPEHKIQLWPGYKTSIRQHEKDILLCAEISFKVMRMETLLTIYQDCVHNTHNFQEMFKKKVIGTTVLTSYNNKTYRIDDVDFNSNPRTTFDIKGVQLSLVDYYRQRYNLNIRSLDQPLLVSQSTERQMRAGESTSIMLVPELCRATGITDSMRNDFRLMKAIADTTQLGPRLRIQRLNEFNKRLQNTAESLQVMSSWQLQLDKNLVELAGRVLPIENVVFGKQRKFGYENGDWNNALKDITLFQPIELKKWFVIVTADFRSKCTIFIDQIIQVGNKMQMRISPPQYQVINNDRTSFYLEAAEVCAKNDSQLIMCIVSNNNAERYGAIKKKLIVDRPIPSQVVVSKTCLPKRGKPPTSTMSIATKVAIQINCKLKGAPWLVEIPLNGLMTVGFDVCHSTRDPSKSYGALVATMDLRQSARFFSSVSLHNKGQELSNEITLMMGKALKQYREIHNSLPQKIVFYRDGVGEGQLHQVVEHEVDKLTKKLNEIYINAGIQTGCPFAFVVVTKKINTRIFDLSSNQTQFNPNPGTVVDSIITLPERYDFFLVSQSVRQGTASPTSYNVIYDTSGLNATRMQILTYKFTHLYYNWTGTLQVPAVCQYAHKLAFLIGQSVHQLPSNVLETQLFYL